MEDYNCIIIQNIISPYKTLLFNALEKITDNNFLFKVLYLAETENRREWKIDIQGINFPYEVMFKGSVDGVDSIKMAYKIHKKLKHHNPDIVIVGGYNYLAFWGAFIWAKKNQKKIIAMIESHYLDKHRILIKESIKKIFVSRCDGVLVDGLRHKSYVINLGIKEDKVFIKKGAGPVDVSWYQNEISKYEKNKLQYYNKLNIPEKNFLYVGRFSPEKNIIYLLRCFKKLQEGGIKDWGMILVGDGPQKKEIEKFINKNNIINIYSPGFLQKEEIPFYFALASCFILPSVSEPWGLVVSEAMACGLPVLVSKRCGCYPDLIQEGVNGFSFAPFNEEELIALMKNTAQGKYNLELMGKASLKIVKDFTPDKSAKIIKNAILSIKSTK